jgi:hypothetical protein
MTNHTPEGIIGGWAPKSTPPKCGWCSSAHVSGVYCICESDCDVGWCCATEDLQEVKPYEL